MKVEIKIDYNGASIRLRSPEGLFKCELGLPLKSGFVEASYQGVKVNLSVRDSIRLRALAQDVIALHHLTIGQSDESPTSRVPMTSGDVVINNLLTHPHMDFIGESNEVPADCRQGSMEPLR